MIGPILNFSSARSHSLRKWIATGLCCLTPISFASAQQASIEPVRPSAPILWRPYRSPEVPAVRLTNSGRLRDLVRGGILYLTVQEAIGLALENDIDIEVARYNPIASVWRLERAEAGGALPGVPTPASQASFVTNGQGVLGSQAAAGVRGGSLNGNTAGAGGNATITQIGPTTQTLDPSLQDSTTFGHRTLPQPNIVQTTPVLIQDQRVYRGSLQEGFLSGGSVSVLYTNQYLNENSPTDVLNPSSAPNLSISFQHNLLRGFGVAMNARNITVDKMNVQTSDLSFKTQVIGTVVSVLNAYYSLVADYEDIKAKRSALEVAQQFVEDCKKQVQIGVLTDIDVTRAESQVAASQQNLVISQTNLRQHQVQLKNLISRTGVADPVVAGAQIVPVDRILIPDKDNLPATAELVHQTLENRSDLALEKVGVTNAETLALGTTNGLLPTLVAFGGTSQAGLAGTARTVTFGPSGGTPPTCPAPLPTICITANPYFVGGIGTALGQVFRRNFPTENAGVFALAPFRNRQAQADYGIDQLQLRQTQLTTQKDIKQAEVDVLNAVIALQQARARYDAAARNRLLAQQLLDAERKKFTLGASTPYNVVQQQRDLATAQSGEIAALATYSNARVLLDQTAGTTLETNHISIADARAGK
jgi:outer membrane protein TolC